MLNTKINLEQINCDGYLSNERLFFYCQTCEKKKMLHGKKIEELRVLQRLSLQQT